ncbi:hypothetical protein LPB86_18200 [Pedobacter sp. MC2016-14]|uniref:hypothetical protein n=1 Tax=Pedobacter sp. MC2016-14 TaxID=2897327 RepID=UPI001E337FAE|nr:hypothetical protein [Pedobacter sp. MC2016-14]MCD0490179.1 hypothetical protein [Pedobacter sp. MC2016-14]
MKTKLKFFCGILLAAAIISCIQQTDYKVSRDEVMKLHDVVMADQSRIVDNQMKADTLLGNLSALKIKFPDLDTIAAQDTLRMVSLNLARAEEAMNTWMHEFEPDVTGKSNEQAVKYFMAEKLKIASIDSMYKAELKSSDVYLHKFKK